MGSWEYGKMPSTVIIKRNVECWLSKKKKPKRKVRWKRGKSLWRGKCFNKKFINAFLPLKTFSQRHTNSNSFSWRDMRWRWTKKKIMWWLYEVFAVYNMVCCFSSFVSGRKSLKNSNNCWIFNVTCSPAFHAFHVHWWWVLGSLLVAV